MQTVINLGGLLYENVQVQTGVVFCDGLPFYVDLLDTCDIYKGQRRCGSYDDRAFIPGCGIHVIYAVFGIGPS